MELHQVSPNVTQSPIHVLLVDDDAGYAGVVQHTLNSFPNRSFAFAWVPSGEEAIRILSRENAHFQVVLMDYYLPDGNGLEVAKRIIGSNIPAAVILLTSNRDFRVAVEAMKQGVEEYLIKEQATDTILPRTIASVFDRVRLKMEIRDAEVNKLISQKKTEAVQELVVTMCHEFNNPLAAIKISTDILSRQKITDEDKNLLAKLNSNISVLEKQIIKLRDLTTNVNP